MFGKFMNNYYYGKSGKGDYTPEDLPKTRMQLFFEMLRVRLNGLCRMNLIYMLPWIPTMLVIGMLVMFVLSIGTIPTEEVTVTNEDGTVTTEYIAQDISDEEMQAMISEQVNAVPTLIYWSLILLVPCIAITGPWTAGVAYVTRNWARDEHAFIWSDMKDAMKENWKQALGLSAITSFMPLLAYMCWEFYGGLAVNDWFMVIPQMFTVMIAGVWFMAVTYAYPMLVTYKMSFGTIIKNSLLLAIGRLPLSVGVRLLHLVPTALTLLFTLLFNSIWVPLVLFGYYILIGFALSRFVTASYTNAQFDKYINSRIEGAQVNRGLAEADDEDYEDEEEERELKPWENGYASQDK